MYQYINTSILMCLACYLEAALEYSAPFRPWTYSEADYVRHCGAENYCIYTAQKNKGDT